MFQGLVTTFAAVKNCPNGQGSDCFTTIPTVQADQASVDIILGIMFGVLGAMSVLIIIIQAMKFVLSSGDPQKAADARKAIIYALVGLTVAIMAEVIVRVVISRL